MEYIVIDMISVHQMIMMTLLQAVKTPLHWMSLAPNLWQLYIRRLLLRTGLSQ